MEPNKARYGARYPDDQYVDVRRREDPQDPSDVEVANGNAPIIAFRKSNVTRIPMYDA